jgi:hypothetical protein
MLKPGGYGGIFWLSRLKSLKSRSPKSPSTIQYIAHMYVVPIIYTDIYDGNVTIRYERRLYLVPKHQQGRKPFLDVIFKKN